MKFHADELTAGLRAMLFHAGRHDLIASGFEVDDATLATSREMRSHPDHAVYHALFDKSAPHAAVIGPLAESPESGVPKLLMGILDAAERSADAASRRWQHDSTARLNFHNLAEASAERRTARRLALGAAQIAVLLAILAVLCALFARPAHAQGGNGGTAVVAPITTAGTGGAALTCYITSGASTNATNCKAAPGNVYTIRLINTTATVYFLRMYNLAAAPTCSSATGFMESIPIPASATGAGIAITQYPQGYTTGIGFCLTGGGASTDNSNAVTGVYVAILYK